MTIKRYINGTKIESDYFKNLKIKDEKLYRLINKAKNRMDSGELTNISTKNAS